MGLPRPSRQIGDRSPTLPLGGGLLIDPEALGQRPQALLTMLYRSTDRLSRRGAPVQNPAHSASFESLDKDAPSKAGTKQLADELFAEGSPADLVDRYARRLPLSVICELLGLPLADRRKFTAWANGFTRLTGLSL